MENREFEHSKIETKFQMFMQTIKLLKAVLFIGLAALVSCEDKVLLITSTDEASVENEVTADSFFEETDDLSVLAVASDDATVSGGKTSSGGRRIFGRDSSPRHRSRNETGR